MQAAAAEIFRSVPIKVNSLTGADIFGIVGCERETAFDRFQSFAILRACFNTDT
jgi:hypothetical protein